MEGRELKSKVFDQKLVKFLRQKRFESIGRYDVDLGSIVRNFVIIAERYLYAFVGTGIIFE